MKNINNYRKSLLLLSFFLILFITGTFLISLVPKTIQYSTKSLKTIDGETISVEVIEPRKTLKLPQSTPAVIIGHGFMANKEFMRGYAIELAAAGFIVVSIDFRGHGQSSGVLSNTRLVYDVLAAKAYLATRLDVNIHNLAYIGYSMGGFPGSVIVHNDPDFKAFIGVGTGLQYGLRQGNATHPLNVLMIHAKYDEAFNLETLKRSMGLRTGLITPLVDVNQLYGSFQEGNASMIYLDDNSNHLSVAWDTDFIRASRNWLISTFPYTLTLDEDFYAHIRLLILILQIISGFGLFFALIFILSKLFGFHPQVRLKEFGKEKSTDDVKKRDSESEKNELLEETLTLELELKNISTKKLVFLTPVFTILLGVIGIFLILWAFLPFPQPIEAFVLALLFGQTFGSLILIWRLGKRHNLTMKNILGKPFSIGKKILLKQLVLGIFLAGCLYAILYLSIGSNYLGIIPSLQKLPWTPIYILISFFIFLIYDILILLIIQPKFSDNMLHGIKTVGIHFGVLFIYINVYLLLMSLLTGSLFFWGVMIPVSTPMLILSACTSYTSYKQTGNIITGAIINAIYFSLVVTAIAPYQGLFTLFSVF
ncbi:MAG: alpha/beta fold hydrolase [Candidatus Lokiarchaeota archaeon]|nr:alpha/beta fold hydrolase [Candidatus Lokiarchaeota archaeon]